jgi:hypothetical protein
MGMTRFTNTESSPEVLSPEQHVRAQDALKKMGKTSAQDLTEAQRRDFTDSLDDSS